MNESYSALSVGRYSSDAEYISNNIKFSEEFPPNASLPRPAVLAELDFEKVRCITIRSIINGVFAEESKRRPYFDMLENPSLLLQAFAKFLEESTFKKMQLHIKNMYSKP
ncbi:hypothetical protein FACS189449_09440 [Alphaproteobacteria bacterium]|nr:hypothetical protein FACS189449_09440 [Alphaproteobacteria bacterium]